MTLAENIVGLLLEEERNMTPEEFLAAWPELVPTLKPYLHLVAEGPKIDEGGTLWCRLMLKGTRGYGTTPELNISLDLHHCLMISSNIYDDDGLLSKTVSVESELQVEIVSEKIAKFCKVTTGPVPYDPFDL